MKLKVVISAVLLLGPLAFSQTAASKWGAWKTQDIYTSAIGVRTRCLSTENGDSKWAFQFKNRAEEPVDFVARVEQGSPDSKENILGLPHVYSPATGEVSSVYEVKIHGTCETVKQMKIKLVCVAKADISVECERDTDGQLIDTIQYSKH